MPEERIGVVDDYFAKVGVAGIVLEGPLAAGDKVHIRGHTTDLELTVDSMQIEREPVQQANAGESIGIKVAERCRGGDVVYKVT